MAPHLPGVHITQGVNMKPSSYAVISPAVQDRFWSRAEPQDNRPVTHADSLHASASRLAHDQTKSLRKEIPFNALVDFWITYSIPWHVLELGIQSALVRMDTGGLRVGESMDFVLRFKVDRQPSEHHIPAVVEKIEPRGVTLRFAEYDEETRRDLVKLLYAL
jgi:hypothetical protein